MANLRAIDGQGTTVYLKGSGSGTDSDPIKLIHGDTWAAKILDSLSTTYTSVTNVEKLFIVPSGREWQILAAFCVFSTGSVAGNRQLTFRFEDSSSSQFAAIPAGIKQGSSSSVIYTAAVGVPDLTFLRDGDKILVSLPPLVLPSGCKIRILDSGSIDPALDNLVVRLNIMEKLT